MISHTHSECPGTVECLAWALGGADKSMIVIAFEMQLPAGGNAHGETHATGQTGVEAVVVTINKHVGPASVRTGIVGLIDIAIAILGNPITGISTSHNVNADSLATDGEVGHQGELQILVLIESRVLSFHIVIGYIQLGGIILRNQGKASADAEPLVELVAGTSLEVQTTIRIPLSVENGLLDVEGVA